MGESETVRSVRETRAPKRRVLVSTPFPPRLDARHGGKATAQLLFRLAARREVAVICLRRPGEDPVDPAIAERCSRVEEVSLPEASRTGLGRTVRRVRWALGLVRGVPPWAMDCRSRAYAARLRALAADWQPDVCEFHLLVMAQYAAALESSRTPRILLDYDPGSGWAAELLRSARGLRWLALRAELAAWRRYETATRRRFDRIVVFAERDVPVASSTALGVPVVTIPLGIDIPQTPLDPVGSAPPTVLFVGGFGHPPNVDGAQWMADAVFPRVRTRAHGARLELVGHRPGKEIQRLATDDVYVHGSVPDVTPYLDRAAVVVAPLRIGGSVRMKVLETLAAGKALVATPRAVEGVDATPGEHFLLADSEEAFASAVAELLLDPQRRLELAARARAWAELHLGWDRPVAAFEQLYDSLPSASRAAGPRPPGTPS